MDKLLGFIKEYKSKYSITSDSTIAEKLRYKAFSLGKSDEDWLILENEIIQYIASDPPKSELDILYGFSEMVSMTCSAIRWKDSKK